MRVPRPMVLETYCTVRRAGVAAMLESSACPFTPPVFWALHCTWIDEVTARCTTACRGRSKNRAVSGMEVETDWRFLSYAAPANGRFINEQTMRFPLVSPFFQLAPQKSPSLGLQQSRP